MYSDGIISVPTNQLKNDVAGVLWVVTHTVNVSAIFVDIPHTVGTCESQTSQHIADGGIVCTVDDELLPSRILHDIAHVVDGVVQEWRHGSVDLQVRQK